MDKSGYIFPSGVFISIGVDNLVGLKCNGGFYTGFIFQGHQKGVAKVIAVLCIIRIRRKLLIWYGVLIKLWMYFDVLVSRKKVLSDSSHCTLTDIYVVVEVIDVHKSVAFQLCIDEEFVEFW